MLESRRNSKYNVTIVVHAYCVEATMLSLLGRKFLRFSNHKISITLLISQNVLNRTTSVLIIAKIIKIVGMRVFVMLKIFFSGGKV